MPTKTTLQTICNKYCQVVHNQNFSIGGGLDGCKFASRRHEDALNDAGKLTLGAATQLFKKATGLSTEQVRDVLHFAVPRMEWHHAGKLPKAYGGGMKKTYFLNAQEICEVASNWSAILQKMDRCAEAEKNANELKKSREERQQAFLAAHAKKIVRVSKTPKYFYKTAQEMNGKYGWFDSTYKSYNMPEYFSGWEFENKETLNQFLNIK